MLAKSKRMPRIAKAPLIHVPREREGMSSRHLEDIRKLPCVACGKEPCGIAHHLLRTGEHGTGRRSSDKWAIPLCLKDHDPNVSGSLHHSGDEDGWLSARNIDGRALAASLWGKRRDIEALRRIVVNVRSRAALAGRAVS